MKSKSVKRMLSAMLLVFESLIVFLATVLIAGFNTGDDKIVWLIGMFFTLVLLATPAILGRKGSYTFGWILQAGIVALGFQHVSMFYVGGVFACMWAWAMIAGTTIDKAKAVLENQSMGQTGLEESKEA